jgi:glucose/arabinose dehydrogenase
MHTPTSFAFHGGTVFEGDGGVETAKIPNGGVFAIRHGIATLIPGSPLFVSGLHWRHGALYVAGGAFNGTSIAWVIEKWTGWNGTMFAHQRTIYRAPEGFQGFNGIGFGANGRLYVGVDVGLLNHNDHGPADISPHVYQILSMTAGGRHVRVFARGIRQPWQMVFPRGSNSPYVTNLGQDSGAKNPPDFILRVRAGQNYGFPKCNHTDARACRHFARPWRMLRPHLDPMGIVLRRGTLYITSFLGPRGKGPGGVVYALRARRHSALRPLVRGFVAPIVGLGRSGRWLYVGELTGQVFRVRI